MPHQLGILYTQSPTVLTLIIAVLPIVGIMQLFDALQVTVLGILRGMGDVSMPSVMHPIGLWCVGLPLAAFFSSRLGWGLAGLWGGLTLAIIGISIVLLFRLIAHSRAVLNKHQADINSQPLSA